MGRKQPSSEVGFSHSLVCFVGLTAVCLLSGLIENMQIFSLMLEIVCLFGGLICLLIAPERGRSGFKCVMITEGLFKSPQGGAIKRTRAVRRNRRARLSSGQSRERNQSGGWERCHRTQFQHPRIHLSEARKKKSFLAVRFNGQVVHM